MKIYDTAVRDHVNWQPGPEVRMYVCGITPYDSAHLGHIFTFMAYDLIQRRLEADGHRVLMARNITDVDEPIYRRAAETGVHYTELAASETGQFREVMRRLYFREPEHEPLASRYIAQMAEAVGRLRRTGIAYQLGDDLYFDTSRDPAFGSLSGFDDKLLLGLMKKRGGDPGRPGKRQPLDFLLWKGIADPADPAAWNTELGRGRPGWHIECSVMSSELLGLPFDLHGGGNDLIFPHHECEASQARALGFSSMVRHWLHVAPILYGGEKMSKSLGNLVFARDLLDHFSPAAIRLALMHYHYREGGEWIPQLLQSAERLLERLDEVSSQAPAGAAQRLYREVCQALDDDLDTHRVLHGLQEFADGQSRWPASGDDRQPDAGYGSTLNDTMNLLGLIPS